MDFIGLLVGLAFFAGSIAAVRLLSNLNAED